MQQNMWLSKNSDVNYLDNIILDENKLLKLLPYEVYSKIDISHLQIWANKNGIYTLPTTELIEWIKNKINNRKAIEICSGNGVISRELGIIGTDSFMQTTPEMVAYYSALGQKPIDPPSDIYQFEANEAVDVLKPKVVIASFATQKFIDGDEENGISSSVYGVDELTLLPKIQTYIFIGNDSVHSDKRINQFPHETHRFDWLITRCKDQKGNFIKIWSKND